MREESVARLSAAIYLGLLLFVGLAVHHLMAQDLATWLFEKQPTFYKAADFAETYRGERWLTVEGHLATEAMRVFDLRDQPDSVFLYVPVVPRDWKPADPVHVVSVQGPGPRNGITAWVAQHRRDRPYTVTGMVGRDGGRDCAELLPALHVGQPNAAINAGQEPVGPWPLIVMIVLGSLLTYYPIKAYREARRRLRERAESTNEPEQG